MQPENYFGGGLDFGSFLLILDVFYAFLGFYSRNGLTSGGV